MNSKDATPNGELNTFRLCGDTSLEPLAAVLEPVAAAAEGGAGKPVKEYLEWQGTELPAPLLGALLTGSFVPSELVVPKTSTPLRRGFLLGLARPGAAIDLLRHPTILRRDAIL